MAVTCTADNLATLSECFAGMDPVQMWAVKISLLLTWADIDIEEAIPASACFEGMSLSDQQSVKIYLLCQIANS